MYPPIFQLAVAWPAVTTALGTSPTRFWPFSLAPSPTQQGYAVPYAVHQLVYGNPDNSLSCVPSTDLLGVQVDAYAKSVTDARNVAEALRDAFENAFNHVVAWNGEDWEAATGLYRVSMTVEFWTDR